jgi:hypothetical protein
MSAMSPDTQIDAARFQVSVLRDRGVEGRAKMTMELCDNLRTILRDGIRHRHPEYDERAVEMALFRATLGKALFAKFFQEGPVQP